ncbi:uncharacterized protein BXZ73DRAFT_43644 [Epithele typhae]|uniref:uncharacterized protein n=1 Tax=Epithele typhae TaxID=378194 RepID=UPI0020080DA8|nr:uncharacterized protein BXZ73DRAFT_43644 [Epithele typhae]KAH9939682.1 hypothetical protein BXZ73DRAFT_43644 [Epithele typhae]
MWIISGPFDEDHNEGQAPEKKKLLKPGKTYELGRRELPLQIKSKAISKLHASFVVGTCDEDQATDPSFIPTLTLRNLTKRVRPVERPSLQTPRMACQGDSSMELTALPGIHLVPTPHPDVTHHLAPAYALTPAIATSLLSVATFVKPEWLGAVVAAGTAAEEGEPAALETTYVLPSTRTYRPGFSPGLPAPLKKHEVWEPNEERATLFAGCVFVFVGEKGAEAGTGMHELVKRGRGSCEAFAIDKGMEAFQRTLGKAQAKGTSVVLVAASSSAVAAVGKEGWRELVQVARRYAVRLRFVEPEKIVDAAAYAQLDHVDSACDAQDEVEDSLLPDGVPNSIENEPSINPTGAVSQQAETEPPLQLTRKRPLRRATSHGGSRAPSPPPAREPVSQAVPDPAPEPVVEAPPPTAAPPRRALVRRARARDPTPSEDISAAVALNRASVEPSEEPVYSESVPPTPSRPSRLKRRVGTHAQNAASVPSFLASEEPGFVPEAKEPPLKKFKSLFEESDPDRVSKMSVDEYSSQHMASGGSTTQYEPSAMAGGASGSLTSTSTDGVRVRRQLGVVPEEEEESSLQSQTRGAKRKPSGGEEDEAMDVKPPRRKRKVQMEEDEAPAQTQAQTEAPPPAKPMSKIVTRVDMAQSQVYVKPKPASKAKDTQQAADDVDKDVAFLKAVASTKRGKKTEDTFDREFNNLRISRPDLEYERQDEEWKILEEFGDDGDKVFGERARPLEVYVQDQCDMGLGSQYWKGSSQTQPSVGSNSQSQPLTIETKGTKGTRNASSQPTTQHRGSKHRPQLVSDSEEEKPVIVDTTTQSGTLKSGQSQGKEASERRRGTKRPLFIQSDEDEKDEDWTMAAAPEAGAGSDDEEMGGTLRSTGREKKMQTTGRGKSAGTRRKAPATVVDDDSDDGATFKAFGARAKTRRR